MSFSRAPRVSCRNNIVTVCFSSAWRTVGVSPAFASSAHAAQGTHIIQSKRIWRWYNVVLARPTCCWRSSGEYINFYPFICVQYFKHTQLSLAITLRTKICVALVQHPLRTSNECWGTTDVFLTHVQLTFNVDGACWILFDLLVPRAGDLLCIRCLSRPANAQRGVETLCIRWFIHLIYWSHAV